MSLMCVRDNVHSLLFDITCSVVQLRACIEYYYPFVCCLICVFGLCIVRQRMRVALPEQSGKVYSIHRKKG